MIIKLENEKIRVEANTLGAELWSLKKVGDDTEYLWQGDKTYWAGRATNLFPICGRLTQGQYTYGGKTFEMVLHGFAKLREFDVAAQNGTSVTFRLVSDEETLAMYPFPFVLDVTYTLEGNTVKHTFKVTNPGDGELIFGLGGHPGYNVPLEAGETFEDYYVQFDCEKEPQALVMSDTCYYTDAAVPFPLEEKGCLSLRHSLFDHDAIFLTEMCKAIELKSRKSGRKVRMTYPDMKFLGFWHKPNTEAPYICIEPWLSVPALDGKIDAMETKKEMMHLASKGVYENTITISIE